MPLSIGDYVYTKQESGPDQIGVVLIYVERRQVLTIESSTVTLSQATVAEFPSHSPPAIEDIAWLTLPPRPNVQAMLPGLGGYASTLELPEPVVIDDAAVEAAWLEYRNHHYENRERGKPQPEPEDINQAYLFHIWEWRDGLPSPSAG